MMFDIQEFHEHPGTPPVLQIAIGTERPYPCQLPLLFSAEVAGSRITVSDFAVPGGPIACAAVVISAVGTRRLDIDTGRYELVITHRDTTDRYHVVISDTAIAIVGGGFISWPTAPLIWRVRPNSFSTTCGTLDDASWICDDVRRLVLLEPGITAFALPPGGASPYGAASGAYWYNEPPRVYRYASRRDFDRARAAILGYYQRLVGRQEGMGVRIRTWLGESFGSPF
jgi:hypothetical protein